MIFTDTDDRDQRTQFTAGDALICKHSAATKGYFKDNFIASFINSDSNFPGTPSAQLRKPPIINRGYFARVHSINQTIENFLSPVTIGGTRRRQIISLGSGFDTLSLNLLQREDENLHIYEVDFEKIVLKKVTTCLTDQVIRQLLVPVDEDEDGKNPDTSDIRSKAADNIRDAKKEISKCNIIQKYSFGNIHFISGDLRDAQKVIEKLIDAGLDVTAPTLLLTECVMVYIEKSESEKLCKEFSAVLTDAAWVTYDMITPNDVFGRTMLKNITTARFKIPGFVDFPTLEAQIGRFLSTGWQEARCVTMLSVYNNYISLEERHRVGKLEIFDEIEEWQMLMNHYCLTVAIKGTVLLHLLPEPIAVSKKPFAPLFKTSVPPK